MLTWWVFFFLLYFYMEYTYIFNTLVLISNRVKINKYILHKQKLSGLVIKNVRETNKCPETNSVLSEKRPFAGILKACTSS